MTIAKKWARLAGGTLIMLGHAVPASSVHAEPQKAQLSQRARLAGSPAAYFGREDYPPAALRVGAEGRVTTRLTVGKDGLVSGCAVVVSSGNIDLDEATCRIARLRIRFLPARDKKGRPIVSTYALPVRWMLSAPPAPPPLTSAS